MVMIPTETLDSLDQQANDRVTGARSALDARWRDAMRDLRELEIKGDTPALKRMIFDLILYGVER